MFFLAIYPTYNVERAIPHRRAVFVTEPVSAYSSSHFGRIRIFRISSFMQRRYRLRFAYEKKKCSVSIDTLQIMRYMVPDPGYPYLFPILYDPGKRTERKYSNALRVYNKRLDSLSSLFAGEYLGTFSKCSHKIPWHMKMIEYNHFICHYYCHFSVYSHILLSGKT